ncbi:hypothetical protein Q8A67_000397 [Cirrhinus molitorella]|uniref:AIG1-type G domain-containing protein n=1 Tax=Cirrhinus molitorella TaxID=172907 RepID=A0AA88QFC4_9TELE|nr:hypothetical protein Q8A67_000397 [Cirrhinus molitorella]
MFGESIWKYTIIVFTHGDRLEGKAANDVIACSDKELRNFIHKCSGGFLFFNNKDTTNYESVTELLKKTETLVAINGKSCYSLSFYPASERKVREKMEKILEKRKENIAQRERELVIYCKTEQEVERKKRELWRMEEDNARKQAENPAKQKLPITLSLAMASEEKLWDTLKTEIERETFELDSTLGSEVEAAELRIISDKDLRDFIRSCSGGYVFFNNKNIGNSEQVTKLLEKIDTLVAINGRSCYSTLFYPNSERKIREKQERILEERQEEIARKERELEENYEDKEELERKKRELWREEEEDARRLAENPPRRKISNLTRAPSHVTRSQILL